MNNLHRIKQWQLYALPLARAGGAHEGAHVTGLQVEADILQQVLLDLSFPMQPPAQIHNPSPPTTTRQQSNARAPKLTLPVCTE